MPLLQLMGSTLKNQMVMPFPLALKTPHEWPPFLRHGVWVCLPLRKSMDAVFDALTKAWMGETPEGKGAHVDITWQ